MAAALRDYAAFVATVFILLQRCLASISSGGTGKGRKCRLDPNASENVIQHEDATSPLHSFLQRETFERIAVVQLRWWKALPAGGNKDASKFPLQGLDVIGQI